MRKNRGFTLIEILVVIGIIAILAAVVIIAINPARQFAQARDSQRLSNINSILNAIGQNIADNKGVFTCGEGSTPLPASTPTTTITFDEGGVGINLSPCVVPAYLSVLPIDPLGTTSPSTGYEVAVDDFGRVHVYAATSEPTIPRTEPLEVVR